MEQVHVIRHRILVQGESKRSVSREMGVSRNTIDRYLAGAEPAKRKPAERSRPVLDGVRSRMEELLESSRKWTANKQRLTAEQLHRMLLEEGLSVGYTTVKNFMREWKRSRREVFVPLEYRPGDLAEMDFFEVTVDERGTRRKALMFVMRLMHSGADFVAYYDRQDQISFLDAHVRAFNHFGFIPRRILYDNLKPAVSKILSGSERKLTERFDSLARHYLFEPCFARPYTGHDKGGVEARGRAIRNRYMVPLPKGDSLDEISNTIQDRIDANRDAEKFDAERNSDLSIALPPVEFVAAAVRSHRVSRRALVSVDGALYSAPCHWNGLDITVKIGPAQVELCGPDSVATHPRQRSGGRSVDYRHYLPELARKPGAVRQIAHRLAYDMGAPWTAAWERLQELFGDKRAAGLFCELLRGIEPLGIEVMTSRLAEMLERNEPPLLSLVRGNDQRPLDDAAVPEQFRSVQVQTARASDFDRFLGGAS